jgi:hypothetical protein
MNRYTVRLPECGTANTERATLLCPSKELALVVAEINLSRGIAEIWEGGKRLARMEKQSSGGAPFWKLG